MAMDSLAEKLGLNKLLHVFVIFLASLTFRLFDKTIIDAMK